MGGISPLEIALRQQELKSSQERSANVKKVMAEEAEAHRKSWETLHNNIAIFSSGTIALSITYLGYLQSGGATISHPWLLFVSWSCLLINVPMSLFVPFVYTYYVSYSRTGEFQNAMKTQREAEADALPVINVANMSAAEIPGEIASLRGRASKYEQEAKRSERIAQIYWKVWRCMGFGSRLLFVIGLAFLLIFAMLNTLQRERHPRSNSPSLFQRASLSKARKRFLAGTCLPVSSGWRY
jgi:hypothetical protein